MHYIAKKGLLGKSEIAGSSPALALKFKKVSSLLTRRDLILWGASVIVYSSLDRQGSNFDACVWRAVPLHSSHNPREVILAQLSLCVHKCGMKPRSLVYSFIHTLQENSHRFSTYITMFLIQPSRSRNFMNTDVVNTDADTLNWKDVSPIF